MVIPLYVSVWKAVRYRDNLSVSLRLTAPLKGEPLVRAKILGLPFQERWHGEAVTERSSRAGKTLRFYKPRQEFLPGEQHVYGLQQGVRAHVRGQAERL